ncbi:MAG TPA: hypothetical protein VIP70_12580 [Nitrososphaeraceae archaeon]
MTEDVKLKMKRYVKGVPPSIIDGEIKVVNILDLLLMYEESLYMKLKTNHPIK